MASELESPSEGQLFASASELGIMANSRVPSDRQVTLDNWQRAPWNRWAFLHLRELITTASISRGEDPKWELATRPLNLDDVEFQDSTQSPSSVSQFLDHSWTDSMVVLNRGNLVFERYRNDMLPISRHLSMSVGKSITSLLVGAVVDLGLIDVRLPITHYLPELGSSAFAGAAVQHALDMEVAEISFPDVQPCDFYLLDVAARWCPPQPGVPSTVWDLLGASRSDGRHGQHVRYTDLNPIVLGLIAERVTGSRFPDLVTRLLWVPMGMEFDADITLDVEGTSSADGGFCIAARDYARLGELLLRNGSARGRQVLSEQWIRECRRPRESRLHPDSYGATWPAAAYHNQWWLLGGRLTAVGVHGQMIAIDYASETVVVFLSSAPEPNELAQSMTQRRIVQALCDALR